jgi:hypothetical protein
MSGDRSTEARLGDRAETEEAARRNTLPRNEFGFLDYHPNTFARLVARLSGAERSHPVHQVEYLQDYLTRCETSALVVERHYIDRYYMREYASYYATCFRDLPNYTARIHFFGRGGESNENVSGKAIEDLLRSALTGEQDSAASKVSDHYIGYASIRPIPAVPIGRTVVDPRRYMPGNIRCFPVTRVYEVHFFGIRIIIDGLAFQQQDRGVGACATTAIWTALQCACHSDGMRPPTEVISKGV